MAATIWRAIEANQKNSMSGMKQRHVHVAKNIVAMVAIQQSPDWVAKCITCSTSCLQTSLHAHDLYRSKPANVKSGLLAKRSPGD